MFHATAFVADRRGRRAVLLSVNIGRWFDNGRKLDDRCLSNVLKVLDFGVLRIRMRSSLFDFIAAAEGKKGRREVLKPLRAGKGVVLWIYLAPFARSG